MATPKVFSKGCWLQTATINYVDNLLYEHEKLIKDHPQLYLNEVFRHFEADFEAKGIGDWHRSRWPQLLQDLDLLPEVHRTNRANQDRGPLSDAFLNWQNRQNRQQEAALPLDSQIQIPRVLQFLFDRVDGYVAETSRILYSNVVAAAQDFADKQYNIYHQNRKINLNNAAIKKCRIRAFFGVTVFDQFLGAVQRHTATHLANKVQRTILLDPEPVADVRPPAPVQPRPAGPNVQPVPPQMANPTGGHQLLGHRIHLEVSQDTRNYINQLYTNPFISNLIHHEHPALYLGEVFLHFQTDFQKGIGTSHWPIVLQDLGLLPERYHSTVTGDRVRSELSNAWHRWLPHLEAQPIGHYHQTLVRVPLIMASVFRQDSETQHFQNGSIRYDYLVDEMQRYVDEYPVRDNDQNRANHLQNNMDQAYRFLAIYYLTVIDQFVQVAAHVRALYGGGPLVGPHPRTELLVMVGGGTNAVPLPTAGLMAGPLVHGIDRPGTSGGGGVGSNPAEAETPNLETKRKSTDQGGGPSKDDKKSPDGSM